MKEWKYSENALAIYDRLYFDKLKGEDTPSQVHTRIANFIADSPAEKSKFFNLLDKKIFRPNSPCMINAGSKSKNPHDRALSACYVLGLEDSMDSIIDMWGVCAKIYASGAGSGIPITNLREKGGLISTGGQASGPLAYLNVVDMLSNTVRSGGKTRRAANMGIFKYDHPDIMEILDAKLNGSIQTFNLSMSVDDKFMKRKHKNGQVHLLSPSKGELKDTIKRDDIWNKAINNAWTNGDPGLFFFDTVNKFNPFPSLGDIDCTNPCGEVPLPPWSVCNIGSINVAYFVQSESPSILSTDKKLTEKEAEKIRKIWENKYSTQSSIPILEHTTYSSYFNWDEFKKTIPDCFKFLDNVIDKQEYIHPKFMKNAKDWRPVGLGIMGFADALIKLGIPYDSQEAMDFFENLCFELNYECIKKSIEMAKDGDWNIDIPSNDYNHFEKLLKYYLGKGLPIVDSRIDKLLEQFDEYGIHNSNWTMIAPTGSTSMSADCSYGWEPLMALIWEKPLVESDQVLKIIHPQFEKDLKEFCNNQDISFDKIIENIIDNNGSIQNMAVFPQPMRDIYKVAHDIDPIFKIGMQGAGQKWISMAISSTTNLPNEATKENIKAIYEAAWEKGLKGITVFRDGCRDDQIVNFGKQKQKRRKTDELLKRPIKRNGSTVEIKTPHGKFFVTVNFSNGKPIEMFFSVGKQGGLVNVVIDALARICSKGLQAGMDMEWIVDTLEGLKGDTPFWFKIADDEEKSVQAQSIVDALSKVLEYHFVIESGYGMILSYINKENDNACESETILSRCPECHKKGLTHSTGCRGGECLLCGFTNCS